MALQVCQTRGISLSWARVDTTRQDFSLLDGVQDPDNQSVAPELLLKRAGDRIGRPCGILLQLILRIPQLRNYVR